LANTKSAKKRIRQTEKRTARNRVYRSAARTYVKKTRKLIAEGNLDEAEMVAQKAYSTLDKAASKHIIHPGNAARRKGRLMAALDAARADAARE
jgi:small subunit ribosomal protein S20